MATFIQIDEKVGLALTLVGLYVAMSILYPDTTAQLTADAVATVEGVLP